MNPDNDPHPREPAFSQQWPETLTSASHVHAVLSWQSGGDETSNVEMGMTTSSNGKGLTINT